MGGLLSLLSFLFGEHDFALHLAASAAVADFVYISESNESWEKHSTQDDRITSLYFPLHFEES